MRSRPLGPFAVLVALVLADALSAAAPPPTVPIPEDPGAAARAYVESVKTRFERLEESRSLLWDWMVIGELVRLPEVDAIPRLLRALKTRPPKGLEARTHLLSSALGARAGDQLHATTLSGPEAEALLGFLRDDLRSARWCWTAYNAARAIATRPVEGRAVEELVVDTDRSPVLRGAMFLALADAGRTSALARVKPLLEEAGGLRDRKGRGRLREAVAWSAALLCAPILRKDVAAARKTFDPDEDFDPSVLDRWGIASGDRRRRRRPPPRAAESSREAPSPEREAALRALAPVRDLLDEDSLAERTRLQVMRALQHAWGTEVAYEHAESWRQVEASKERAAAGEAARTTVRFFGIPTFGGRRVVFLLDGSDSMLTPLTPAEKDAFWTLIEESPAAELARREETRSSRSGRTRRTSRGRTRVGRAAGRGIPTIGSEAWREVETRFDAARAHLKHTLASMSPDVEFAVVLFGDEAKALRTTPMFMEATDSNRLRVIRELDSISAGPRDAAHPHGTLRGGTNIYEAFALGLSLDARRRSSSGRTRVGSRPVDPEAVDGLADTVYLLSDGLPTQDGFRGRTPVIEREGQWIGDAPAIEGEREEVINPETGATRKVRYRIPARKRQYSPGSRSAVLDETGPYIYPEALADEVRRRNLFVRATVHVVAIGEAGGYLGADLARAGGGRCLRISAKGEREER